MRQNSVLKNGAIYLVVLFMLMLAAIPVSGQEQDAETKALDATATQWSFQFAYQSMPDYHQDMLDNGQMRSPGSDNYLQLRIVAPIPLKALTILPRLTLRHYENAQGESGFGNTELFALMVPKAFDWGTGRTGLGPLVTLPGDKKVARDEWGYGLAGAIVNSSGKWFYGLLLTQSWRAINPTALPPGSSDTNPLGITPEDVPEDLIEKEKEIYRAQALEMGKPENVIDKIVEGKLKKFYEESCLLNQPYVRDTDISVADLLAELIAKIGENISIKRFVRYQIGE